MARNLLVYILFAIGVSIVASSESRAGNVTYDLSWAQSGHQCLSEQIGINSDGAIFSVLDTFEGKERARIFSSETGAAVVEIRQAKTQRGAAATKVASVEVWKRSAISADGMLLAIGSTTGSVLVYGMASGKLKWKSRLGDSIRSVVFDRNSKRLLVAARGGQTSLLEAANGKVLRLIGPQDGVASAAFSSDGRHALTTIPSRIWDIDTGLSDELRKPTETTSLSYAQFSASGQAIVGSDTSEETLWVYRSGVANASLLMRYQKPANGTYNRDIKFAVSPDSERVISAGEGAEVNIHDLTTGELLVAFEPFEVPVASVALLSGGRIAVIGNNTNRDCTIKVYKPRTNG